MCLNEHAEKPNEMKKNLDELSNEDLLNEAKKMKSTAIINATLIGVLIGILIYSIAVNKFGFLTLILLFLIYKFANNSKYNKEEIENLLKVRNLK
jgi:F0F1-type ATP synthase assembly protein I